MTNKPRENIHIRNMKFECTFWKTIDNGKGSLIDMYFLWIGPEDIDGAISIGVPHGRKDLPVFIYRALMAGQRVLNDPRYPKHKSIEEAFRP